MRMECVVASFLMEGGKYRIIKPGHNDGAETMWISIVAGMICHVTMICNSYLWTRHVTNRVVLQIFTNYM